MLRWARPVTGQPHTIGETACQRTRLITELCRLIDTHLGEVELGFGELTLFSADVADEPTSSIADAAFAFVAQGAKQVAVGEHVVDYGPGEYLVVSVDLPVTGRFTVASKAHPFLGIGLTLDPDAIASLLLEHEMPQSYPSRIPRLLHPALGASHASVELLDALARMLRLIDAPEDRNVLAPLVYREVIWRLLRGEHGDLIRQIGTQGSNLAHVGQAVRWIRTHYAEPFRVEDLAKQFAMSPSSLHRHFRAATSMGPIQFQKKIRLQQARLLLASSASDVTGVASAVGYESPSQFSREYRREWGTSPRSDRHHVRSA